MNFFYNNSRPETLTTFRLRWQFFNTKHNVDPTPPLNITVTEDRLTKSLKENDGFIGDYQIEIPSISVHSKLIKMYLEHNKIILFKIGPSFKQLLIPQ